MPLNRRHFLESAAGMTALSAAALWAQPPGKAPASERLRVGCVGVGGRAAFLTKTFAALPEVDVVQICDIDPHRLQAGKEALKSITGKEPSIAADYRELIDNKELDAVVVGTPDHWHAIPTILACLAGKDVYVEKPDGHNIVEGQRMVAAMKKHKRIVQMGTQSRTSPHFRQAMEFLKTGKLGRCLFAKAWESGRQGSIGRPADSDPPAGVNYDLWLGAAPKRAFNPRRFHGNWRWFFDYGTGDLGNDGVHRLDVARWALSSACEANGEQPLVSPTTISSTGGHWYFDDMQEWPDTLQVNYSFEGSAGPTSGKILTYEMRVWTPYRYLEEPEGAAVFGDQGYIVLGNARWRAFNPKGEIIAEGGGGYEGIDHMQNFVDCVKSRQKPNADLETVGHPSSVLCHAGNVAWRTGKTLRFNAQTEEFDDSEANALRTRPEYRAPYLLPEV